MIRLAQSQDKRLIVVSNQEFPSDVRRVEYFRDLKLMMLVFENEEDGSDLMPCEIADDVAQQIIQSPEAIIVAMAKEGAEPYGYQVPLVQIGV